jgi:hypothetical protein
VREASAAMMVSNLILCWPLLRRLLSMPPLFYLVKHWQRWRGYADHEGDDYSDRGFSQSRSKSKGTVYSYTVERPDGTPAYSSFPNDVGNLLASEPETGADSAKGFAMTERTVEKGEKDSPV